MMITIMVALCIANNADLGIFLLFMGHLMETRTDTQTRTHTRNWYLTKANTNQTNSTLNWRKLLQYHKAKNANENYDDSASRSRVIVFNCVTCKIHCDMKDGRRTTPPNQFVKLTIFACQWQWLAVSDPNPNVWLRATLSFSI